VNIFILFDYAYNLCQSAYMDKKKISLNIDEMLDIHTTEMANYIGINKTELISGTLEFITNYYKLGPEHLELSGQPIKDKDIPMYYKRIQQFIIDKVNRLGEVEFEEFVNNELSQIEYPSVNDAGFNTFKYYNLLDNSDCKNKLWWNSEHCECAFGYYRISEKVKANFSGKIFKIISDHNPVYIRIIYAGDLPRFAFEITNLIPSIAF